MDWAISARRRRSSSGSSAKRGAARSASSVVMVAAIASDRGQVLVHELDGHGSLADRTGDAFDRPIANVPGDEHPGHARLQQERLAVGSPSRRWLPTVQHLAPGKDEARLVAEYGRLKPVGARGLADEYEERRHLHLLAVRVGDRLERGPLELLLAIHRDDLHHGAHLDVWQRRHLLDQVLA